MFTFLTADPHRAPDSARARRSRRRTGCLIAFVVVALVVAVAIHFLGKPIRAAKRTEQMLNDTYLEAAAFTPPADGSVAPERIEAFLQVRRRVFSECGKMQDIIVRAGEIGAIEEDTTSTGPVKVVQALQGFRRLFGFGPQFLAFMNARNGVLLEAEMGLGEYMYIYVLAYNKQLRAAAAASDIVSDDERLPSDRARRELARILDNQLTALTPAASPADSALAVALERQIRGLEQGRQRVPWSEGLPRHIEAAFEPYFSELAHHYCEGLVRLELLQKNKGLQFKG